MDARATIYAERSALTDVLRKAFDKDGLENIIKIFKDLSDICVDMSDAELRAIFTPDDLDNVDDLFTIFNAYGISTPIALKDFFDQMSEKEDLVVSKPNAFFLRKCSTEEAQKMRDKYGVWVISEEEVSNRMFEYLSFKDEFGPRTTYGKSSNGWQNIIHDNDLKLPPSNSLIISDNFLLSNEVGDQVIGLSNLTHLFDAILPKKLSIPYYILIMSPAKDDVEKTMKRRVKVWMDGLIESLHRDYEIKVEFVLSSKVIHKRVLYLNYAFIGTEKGFKIFKPFSNEVYKDGDQSNSAWTYTYFHDPFRAGRGEHQLANDDIEKVREIYKKAKDNHDNQIDIIGQSKFVGVPASEDFSPNRIFE